MTVVTLGWKNKERRLLRSERTRNGGYFGVIEQETEVTSGWKNKKGRLLWFGRTRNGGRAIPFLELLFTHASILIMLGVSFGRYYAVCRPLQSYSTCGRSRTLVMMSCMWGVAAIFAVPMVIIAHIETATFHRDASIIEVCRTHIFLTWHYAYVICIFCVFFVIPFFVMLFIYSSIIHGVLRESTHIEETSNTKSFRRTSLRNQRQIVCMLFVIVVVFFLCTLPLRIVIFWFAFTDEIHIRNLGLEGYLNLIWCGRVFQYLNSAINPIIYSAFSSKFRWAFKYILGMKKREDCSWSRTSQRTSAHYSFIKQSKQRELKEQYM
ncbi:neuromedin-U receptor 2-like [Ylistrum balloti]|uniref:neuromedin-U receptor 2-like n=1 Tax=Ylistrum balloti TaxID=509963 RepID=UPI002905DA24|nr:neuromedin-U receptor 2-like [Ylistrum balloti]